MTTRITTVAATVVAVAMFLRATPRSESPQTFDVVSIKPSLDAQPGARLRIFPGGRVEFRNTPLSVIVLIAYQFQEFSQVDGLPDWTHAERFDLDAKADVELPSSVWASNSRLPSMLQSMLTDRCRFVRHLERRMRPIYSLVKARSDGRLGPQLTLSAGDCTNSERCGIRASVGYYAGRAVPVKRVADFVASALGRPVVDNTGLSGDVDFELRFRVEPPAAGVVSAPPPTADDPNIPTLTTALQEQLGLKIESTTAATDVLVIENLERPTPN
jgi:bla regulator protein blaR1